MKSARSKLVFFVLGLVFFAATASAAEVAWTEEFKQEFAEIKDRLTKIEQQQQEIIAKEGKIMEELDRIRIWVHRK